MKLIGGVGGIVNVRIRFTDPDNNDTPYDPASVTLRVRNPDRAVTTYTFGIDPELTQESAGRYLFRLSLANEGTYRWTWSGTSPQKAVVVSGSCDAVEGV